MRDRRPRPDRSDYSRWKLESAAAVAGGRGGGD